MAQNLTPLTPTVDAAQSADIVVTTLTTVFAYTADGKFPTDFQAVVLRKVGANYQLMLGPDLSMEPWLSKRRLEWTLATPGTYAVRKSVSPTAIGVGTDS